MMRVPSPSALLALASLFVAPVAHAQLRGQREGIDTSSLAVVFGLLVLGIGAYFLARGRK